MMDDERRGTRDETTPRSVGRVLCLTSPRTCRTFELLFCPCLHLCFAYFKKGTCISSIPFCFVFSSSCLSRHPGKCQYPRLPTSHGLIRRPIRDPKTRRRCLYRCRKLKRPLGPALPSATQLSGVCSIHLFQLITTPTCQRPTEHTTHASFNQIHTEANLSCSKLRFFYRHYGRIQR